MLEGGNVAISALTYADDSALTCDTKTEALQAVLAVRLGFRKDADKKVSRPKTRRCGCAAAGDGAVDGDRVLVLNFGRKCLSTKIARIIWNLEFTLSYAKKR